MVTQEPAPYVGRFAPSPTGPLHFGSLVAAVASYLQARTHNGKWLLRVEDIDPPREQAGATDAILKALDRYEFEWDGDVIFQSDSRQAHEAAVGSLLDRELAYPCGCSRRVLQHARRGPLGAIYPGTCRNGCEATEFAIRLRTTDAPISFMDTLQGLKTQHLESESGDFVIRRRDGLIAYQLAVVVDDQIEGITEVVRGIDLMGSTLRQIWLQRLLNYPTPDYVHIPVVTHPNGDKLSKLTGASAIPTKGKARALTAALAALQQKPPLSLADCPVADVWQWAIENWQLCALKGQTAVSTDSAAMATVENSFW